jgi:hypothetical protein
LLARRNARLPDPTWGADTRAVHEAEDTFNERIRLADTKFFNSIESILGETQKLQMPRVIMHRQRACCAPHMCQLKKATVDLSALIERAQLAPDDLAPVEVLMWDYEQKVTPLLIAVDKLLRENKILFTEFSCRKAFTEDGKPLDLNSSAVAQLQRDLYQRELDLRARCAKLQEQIGIENDKYVELLADKLPPAPGKALKTGYLCKAYLHVYPDPAETQELYSGLSAAPDVGEEQKAAIAANWANYRPQYEAINKSFCKLSDDWQMQNAYTGRANGWQEHNQRVNDLTLKRAALHEKFVKSVRDLLNQQTSPHAWQLLQDWFKDFNDWHEKYLKYPVHYVDFS